MAKANKESQTLEQLTRRYKELEERKIRNHAVLGETQKQLEDLLAQAEEMFGTREVDELQAKLKEMESENEKKRSEYQQQLDQIEENLASISEELGDEVETASRKSPK